MTEEEASKKLCPQSADANGAWCPCIGSKCMAWRWTKVANPDWKPETQMAVYPQTNPYTRTPAHVDSATDGRCGLAGQP